MPSSIYQSLQAALPEGGLFAEKSNLLSPRPFVLNKKQGKELERLGPVLAKFMRATRLLYGQSVKGKQPAYVSQWLDAGKPDWMIDLQRESSVEELPRVIRPDLLLTEEGFSLTELDSVPGGIGLTAFLSDFYEQSAGFNLLGGSGGMLEGFASILPESAKILVSEESADYRPEMEWLLKRLAEKKPEWKLERAEDYFCQREDHLYRFFELFDYQNMPWLGTAVSTQSLPSITPPIAPCFEEKLNLALFWIKSLRGFWEQELRASNDALLRKIIPYSWALCPDELPAHAAIPRLELSSWEELKTFSQKERELVLKISGFSELAWGSRGVHIGSDLSAEDWSARVDHALGEFAEQPWLLQEFAKAKKVEHPYFNPQSGEERMMEGRVRLCPYYFRALDGSISLGGVLATIVPLDKKLIHGMSDAILVPCAVES